MSRIKNKDVEKKIVETAESQHETNEKVIYVSGPKLAMRLGKSFPTILNWFNQERIIADAYVDGDKPNNALFTEETVQRLVDEVDLLGRPEVKERIIAWKEEA